MNSSKKGGIEACFSGKKLYGDDFSPEEIEEWFQEESEGYADLGNKDLATYSYQYHTLNRIHGFRHIAKELKLSHALGFGSAWGYEFEPLVHQIEKLTIIEPSENLRSEHIGPLHPDYVKPRIDGLLDFPDRTFDLVTCFGVLHHIPNVSFVLGELMRVLRPGGVLLLREPITSMGDWTKPRPGLSSNERGIPLSHFDKIFSKADVEVIARTHCFTLTYQFHKIFKAILKKPLYSYGWYIHADRMLSRLLKANVRYHSLKKRHRVAPSNIYFVVRKV